MTIWGFVVEPLFHALHFLSRQSVEKMTRIKLAQLFDLP